jgi:hypothetical protein
MEQIDLELYQQLLSQHEVRRKKASAYYDLHKGKILQKARDKRQALRDADPLAYEISMVQRKITRNEEYLLARAYKGEEYLNGVNRRLSKHRKELEALLAQKMQTEA